MVDRPPVDAVVDAIKDRPGLEVERVDDWVVWLRDSATGERVRRICGYTYPTQSGGGKVCHTRAGASTIHEGTGRCRKHEFPASVLRRVYSALVLSALGGVDNPMISFVGKAQELMQQIDIGSIYHELSALYAICLAKQAAMKEELASTDVKVRVAALNVIQRDLYAIAKLKLDAMKEGKLAEGVGRREVERLFMGMRETLEEHLPVGQREIVVNRFIEKTSIWASR